MWQSMLGIIVFLGIAVLVGEDRSRISVKAVLAGLALQFALGVLLLKLPFIQELFFGLNRLVAALDAATRAGTSMVFGYLGGGALPFAESYPGASFILAFQALPIVLLMSALSALFFYWRILPFIVKGFSRLFQKTMRIGGAEALGVTANIFVGMVESPLLIRPYLGQMTRSELFTLMTCGMATIAGTVMALYARILNPVDPGIMGHILTASIISIPAAITISKIMIPETGTLTTGDIQDPEPAAGAMDAITKGTVRGMDLFINIVAMLVVLVAIVHLCNLILGIIPNSGAPWTLQRIFGYLMAPVVWLMGVPWAEALTAGTLLGTKTILNELLAYLDMSKLPVDALGHKSKLIMTYAMCGFANPGSLGIMIGGLGTMAPDRRDDVIALGFRSIVAGTLATCMTGCIAGILT